jgi:hypothetical protein
MLIIGIDPGVNIGVASYRNGMLFSLDTYTIAELIDELKILQFCNCKVVIEDSRLQSHLFTGSESKRSAALKIARDVGGVDMICRIIDQLAEENNIDIIGISPKSKGKKLGAEEFKKITGWTKQSNQHERDAAMVAWRFRNAKLTRKKKFDAGVN